LWEQQQALSETKNKLDTPQVSASATSTSWMGRFDSCTCLSQLLKATRKNKPAFLLRQPKLASAIQDMFLTCNQRQLAAPQPLARAELAVPIDGLGS
jgi:hypothetical protein